MIILIVAVLIILLILAVAYSQWTRITYGLPVLRGINTNAECVNLCQEYTTRGIGDVCQFSVCRDLPEFTNICSENTRSITTKNATSNEYEAICHEYHKRENTGVCNYNVCKAIKPYDELCRSGSIYDTEKCTTTEDIQKSIEGNTLCATTQDANECKPACKDVQDRGGDVCDARYPYCGNHQDFKDTCDCTVAQERHCTKIEFAAVVASACNHRPQRDEECVKLCAQLANPTESDACIGADYNAPTFCSEMYATHCHPCSTTEPSRCSDQELVQMLSKQCNVVAPYSLAGELYVCSQNTPLLLLEALSTYDDAFISVGDLKYGEHVSIKYHDIIGVAVVATEVGCEVAVAAVYTPSVICSTPKPLKTTVSQVILPGPYGFSGTATKVVLGYSLYGFSFLFIYVAPGELQVTTLRPGRYNSITLNGRIYAQCFCYWVMDSFKPVNTDFLPGTYLCIAFPYELRNVVSEGGNATVNLTEYVGITDTKFQPDTTNSKSYFESNLLGAIR